MKTVSSAFKDALGRSHKRFTETTCTLPNGDVLELDLLPGASITARSGTGSRRTASISVRPRFGVNLYELLATPGAIFDISHGIDFGGGYRETVPVFHGEAATGGANIVAGDIQLSLVDMWGRLERCRFTTPYGTVVGAIRPVVISGRVTDAIPDVVIDQQVPNGASMTSATVWDSSRTDMIKDLSTDMGAECFFDSTPETTFIMRPEPIINQTSPVWTYRTGNEGNLKTAERSRPFDRLYNTVVVKPTGEEQTWTAQTVSVSDPTHPRHPSKVGVVPYFHSSPTLTSAAAAKQAAETILQRVLGTTETVTISAFGNPAQEPGDTVLIIKPPTDTDSGFMAAHLVDSMTLRLDTGDMDLSTRSTSLADLEET